MSVRPGSGGPRHVCGKLNHPGVVTDLRRRRGAPWVIEFLTRGAGRPSGGRLSQRANPTLIGAFVMGSIALLVAGLLVLGSGHFGGDRETLVLYFRYSTTGLKVGAPVVLKGVQIGVVKEIQVAYDDASGRFLVPVYIEIDQSRVQWPGEIRGELDRRELYQKGLEAGLRARLGLQSLVTGMLQVEVAFFPGTKLVLHGGNSRYGNYPLSSPRSSACWVRLRTSPWRG